MAVSSVTYNKPVLPRVSDTSDLASNRASVYSGKALDFDGVNDNVQVSNEIFEVSEHTITGYIKKTGSGTYRTVFGVDKTQVTQQAGLYIQCPNLSTTFQALYYTDSSSYAALITDSLRLNVWYHFAVTFDNGAIKTYLNGVLSTSASVSGTWTKDRNITIGAGWYNNAVVDFWDGQAAHFKVFNVALTATQVAELYNNPEQILPTGVSAVNLKLWLPMMEGAGSYVYNGAAGSLGEELVSNGTVDEVCQKWAFTDNGYVSATGGKLVWNAPDGSGANAIQYLNIVAGRTYRVTLDYSVNRDGFSIVLGNANAQPTQTGTGTYTVDLTPTSTNSGYFSLNMSGGTGDIVGYMDNISVKEVVPQATGTISGATWVAGQGEPLPQTALIDWNKGANLLKNSEAINESNWAKLSITVGENSIAAPNGFPSADKIIETTANSYHLFGDYPISVTANVPYKASCYFKAGTALYGTILINSVIPSEWATIVFDLTTGQITKQQAGSGGTINDATISSVGSGWYLVSIVATINNSSLYPYFGISNSSLPSIGTYGVITYAGNTNNYLYCWGVSFQREYDGYTYVSTAATAQTSPVLLPKGLTTGKDIFGNSIVTPRASGAFNFDGASWATILNNGSVNPTNSVTLEAWVNKTDKTSNTGYHHIISRNSSSSYYYSMFTEVNTGYLSFQGTVSASYKTAGVDVSNGSWNHCVVVYNKSNVLFYINGALVSTQAMTDALTPNSVDLYIGARPNGIQLHPSQIALPRVYDYALTANQVFDNFNQKASTFGKAKVTGELQAYINRTVAAGATVEAHSALLNTLTELENK